MKPNDTGAERSAVVSIRCNNSEVNVSVTQEFEEPSMRTTLGRLARITEYENDKIESVAVFSYDEEERILSVITYLDADLSQKAESWEFSYPPYNSSKVTVTETHYDKTQAYGYVWECEGGFTTPLALIHPIRHRNIPAQFQRGPAILLLLRCERTQAGRKEFLSGRRHHSGL